MAYLYSVRGWLELSWPDEDIEGVGESPEDHAAKVQAVRDLLTTHLTTEELLANRAALSERAKAGWGTPQRDLEGTEYVFYAADIEEPAAVLAQVRQVLALDPFADGYFSVEGEDGEQYKQWLVMRGSIYTREALFPDFEADAPPPGFTPLFER